MNEKLEGLHEDYQRNEELRVRVTTELAARTIEDTQYREFIRFDQEQLNLMHKGIVVESEKLRHHIAYAAHSIWLEEQQDG